MSNTVGFVTLGRCARRLCAATLRLLPGPLSEHTTWPWLGLRHQGLRGGGGSSNDRIDGKLPRAVSAEGQL